jgi:hypothetical protein
MFLGIRFCIHQRRSVADPKQKFRIRSRIRIRPEFSFGFESRIRVRIQIVDSYLDQKLAKNSFFCSKIFTQPHLQK